MKLLWISNAPDAPSGYGTQTRQVGRRIAASGREIEFSANDGSRGNYLWEGHIVHGASSTSRYSIDTAREDVRRSGADWTVVLYDAWVYTDRAKDPFEGLAVAGWVPVDHYPCPPTLIPWLSNHTAIAMSRYGRDRLLEASAQLEADTGRGFPVRFAPHAVDTGLYRPTAVAPGFGKPFREIAGVPEDAFLVGIVGANTGTAFYDRKGFGDMTAALGPFMQSHPDVHVYIHAHPHGPEGVSLPVMLGVAGVPPERVHWADQYLLSKQLIRDEDMAAIYSSFDVLLGTSRGEGFGLPHLEAQACGTPVILSNWTASAELVGDVWSGDRTGFQRCPSGWLVDCDLDYDAKHAAYWGKPRIASIIRALGEAHDASPESRAVMREAARANAMRWDADTVFAEHWEPILREMEAAGQPVPEPIPVNRAARRQKTRQMAGVR